MNEMTTMQEAVWPRWKQWCRERDLEPSQACFAAMLAYMHYLPEDIRQLHLEIADEQLELAGCLESRSQRLASVRRR